MDPQTPVPPPEARLIRIAREATGMTMADAARATNGKVSAAYWRDVERGYGGRRGVRATARASDRILAQMASAVGISPERLETDGCRPEAARILREILRPGSKAARASGPLAVVPGDSQVSPAEAALADLMARYGDDQVMQAIAAQHGKPAATRVAELLEWLDVRAGGQGNGTSG